MPSARHLIIVNPRAAHGRALQASWRVEQLYREAGLDFALERTDAPGVGADIARRAAREFAAVVAVGGDGTLHEIAQGLADAAVAAGDPARIAALGAIPIGTGNDFVKSLGITPGIDGGFAVLRGGRRRRIDLGRAGPFARGERRFEREWFLNDFSAGYAALVVKDMVDPPFYVRLLTGHLAYLAIGLRRVLHKPELMTLVIGGTELARKRERVGDEPRPDGEVKRALFYEIHVGNGRYCGGGIQFTPRAQLDDGLLDVTSMHTIPRWRLVPTMFFQVRGGTLAPKEGVDFARTERLAVEREGEFAVYVDGEYRAAERRVEVEVAPAALDVLAP